MKRIITLSLVLIFALCGTLYAAGVNGTYDGHDVVRVQYEGNVLTPDTVPGILYKGSTLVPLGLLRKAGFNVEWDQVTKTANIATEDPPEPDLKSPLTLDGVKKLSNAVAIVYALDDKGNRWRQGSGFIINSRGLLVTAYHVADEEGQLRALEVEVNGKTYKVPKGVYVFADETKDVFGVYLQDSSPFPYLKVSTELPESIDRGYTISNPNGIRNVATEGYLTAVFKENGRRIISGIFNTDGGSSGGPLLNLQGEVIGIITSGREGTAITVSTGIEEAIRLYQENLNK